MTIRLRENNSLDVAAAWLREQNDDFDGYQAEDILEDARLGKVALWAVVPDWQSTGEIAWLKREKVVVDDKTGEHTYTTSAVRSFIGSDGRIRVTPDMARRLLDHGECGLDCVTMPVIDCTDDPEASTDTWLQGARDGRLIKLEHVRITSAELHSFMAARKKPASVPRERDTRHGVRKSEFLAAPWQFVHGYNYEKLERDLGDPPDWIRDIAMVTPGRPGRGGSATWNPAQLAFAMCSQNKFVRRVAGHVINDVFPDYIAVWKELNA